MDILGVLLSSGLVFVINFRITIMKNSASQRIASHAIEGGILNCELMTVVCRLTIMGMLINANPIVEPFCVRRETTSAINPFCLRAYIWKGKGNPECSGIAACFKRMAYFQDKNTYGTFVPVGRN